MNDNALIVVRAFRGLDKEADCGTDDKPIGRATAMKYGWKDSKSKRGKKGATTKEALSKNVIGDDDVIDVEVERIDKSAQLAALNALESMKKDPEELRNSGVTNSKVTQVGMLRSKARVEKAKQEQIGALGDSLLPKIAALRKLAEGAGTGQPDPYAAFQQMQEDGNTVSKAIPGLDPNVVLQGQQRGVDMTPGAIKKRLGAHEQIAKGKKILADDNKNGIPDVAEGAPGVAGQQVPGGGMPPGAGAPQAGAPQAGVPGQSPLLAAMKQQMPPRDPAQMISAAKLRAADLTKASAGIVADAPEMPSYTGAPDLSKDPLALSQKPKTQGSSFADFLKLIKSRAGRMTSPGRFTFRNPIQLRLPSAAAKAQLLGTPQAKAAADAQNAKKKKDEEEATKPGVLKLELASDEPVEKAPEKKPEKDSENKAETKGESAMKKANMGAGVTSLAAASGLPRRDGLKTTNRQDVFEDLGKWSLGKDM